MSLLLGEDDESSEEEQEEQGGEKEQGEQDELQHKSTQEGVIAEQVIERDVPKNTDRRKREVSAAHESELGGEPKEQLRSPILTPIAMQELDSVLESLSRRLEELRERQVLLLASLGSARAASEPWDGVDGYSEVISLLVQVPAYQSRLVKAGESMKALSSKAKALRKEALRLEQKARDMSLARENARMNEAQKDQRLKASFTGSSQVAGINKSASATGRVSKAVANALEADASGATQQAGEETQRTVANFVTNSVMRTDIGRAKSKRKASRVVSL